MLAAALLFEVLGSAEVAVTEAELVRVPSSVACGGDRQSGGGTGRKRTQAEGHHATRLTERPLTVVAET